MVTIESQWFSNETHCEQASLLFAETAGIPSHRQRRYFKVKNIFFLNGYKRWRSSGGDLALLQLEQGVPEEKADPIELCKEEPELGLVLGACGMGSISNSSFMIPSSLHETFFYESVFKSSHPENHESCPYGDICTETVNPQASLCAMDIGGPLYAFKCGSLEASCLYGVASYYDPPTLFKTGSSISCNGGSAFTNVVIHRKWIEAVMMAETHES
ncbi:uncharacterized protein LOC142338061 [Convolutriloba macropyga]|uniref:uncharacterized protein LOC142338061 n=1 Tax=Convolutriloba macropyga TaxID=536237 RepID=UPI003F51CCBA